MTAREHVERAQRALEIVTAISALLWAVAAAIVAFAAAGWLGALLGIRPASFAGPVTTIASAIAAAAVIWRSRFVWAYDRVSLWIEENAPELRYSLVTAADDRYSAALDPIASPLLKRVDTGLFVRRAALRSLWIPLATAAVGALLVFFLPAAWSRSLGRPAHPAFPNATNSALLAGSKLTPLKARVIPPAYTRLRSEDLDEPSTITGVQGSNLFLTGPGGRDGLKADLSYADGRLVPMPVTQRGDGWSVAMTMADTTPAFIELTDRTYKRAIVLNPRADAPPKVQLRLPARDTALRTAAGTLRLSADVSDDIGLASGQFEYIVSSGAEETFSFKQGIIGGTRFNGERTGTLSLSVPYSLFKLGEGDRLSIRAVATDLNSLTGPGKGFSETRTIRVARHDEYDSLSVEAAAPSGDTAMMSLRMLIIETEKLEKSRPQLIRDTLVSRSRGLARQTDQVRAAVLPLEKEEGTDAPEVTMDTEITTQGVQVAAQVRGALNDLEEASRKLDVADPQSALPPMYRAYKALQSFRNFKRYYFRGATRPVIVDIQRVRLTGKTKGTATPMFPRLAATSDRDRMRASYSAAIEQLAHDPKNAIILLTTVRVESLRKYPELSAALEDALVAIGKGRDATQPLARARRLLEGVLSVSDSIPVWSGW